MPVPPSRANAAETADAAAVDSGRSCCEEEEGEDDDDGAARAGRAFRSQLDATRDDGAMVTETAAIDESRSRRESAEESGAEDDDVAEHVVVDDGIEICEDNDDDVDNRSFGVAFEAVAFGLTDDDALASIDLMMFTLI